MKYEPMSNALGYDIVVSGSKEAWEPVVAGEDTFWKAYSGGEIRIDGDLPEVIVRMSELMAETQQAEAEA